MLIAIGLKVSKMTSLSYERGETITDEVPGTNKRDLTPPVSLVDGRRVNETEYCRVVPFIKETSQSVEDW